MFKMFRMLLGKEISGLKGSSSLSYYQQEYPWRIVWNWHSSLQPPKATSQNSAPRYSGVSQG